MKSPDWKIDDSVNGLHPDAHRCNFMSQHSHRPLPPIHDLLLSDVLSILLPTHRTALYTKFGVVAAAIVTAEAHVVLWIRKGFVNDDDTVVPVTLSLVLLELLLAWTLYYQRVLMLFVDSVIHKQPTWWMDPTVAAVNRLPMHTTGIRFFASEASARRAACVAELATRETSIENASTPNVWKLDSLPWTFSLYPTVPQALDAVQSQAPLPTTPIRVPGNWMFQGFDDIPIYTNIKYPFPCQPPLVPLDNPTGRYCLRFNHNNTTMIPPAWQQALAANEATMTLLIHGVESAAYVYWNDEFVGYCKDSRLPSEFDVTAAIRPTAENVLQIVVVRWSDGSYVEDQDHWWMAGLHRSVELVLRPKHADITDYQVQADANGRLTCRVQCRDIYERKTSGHESASMRRNIVVNLYDDVQSTADGDQWIQGKSVIQSVTLSVNDGNEALMSVLIDNPRRWTAETPNLYTMTISLLVDGQLTQAESCRVGFRSGSIENGQYRVNGVAITVCGINRHEHDPDNGKVVSLESMKRDIVLMKQNNFNAVRTSHYPNHPCFYKLCDFYGLYVCDEANIETHGMLPMGRLAHDPGWYDMFVSRIVRLVRRDRNHACIMFWSLGNEAGRGRNLHKARDTVKRLDPSRPICYESGGGVFWGVGRTELSDMIVNMYPDVPLTVELATRRDEDRPVILCEYSHAMGNSNGNLHLYWQAFWDPDIPRLQGGYIWDMIDQGLRKTTKTGVSYFGYGGDFGDTCNDLQFCCNGLFSPDRVPHPAVAEAKYLQQPVRFDAEGMDSDGMLRVAVNRRFEAEIRLRVTNRYNFLNLDHLEWSWCLKFDGSPTFIHTGNFNIFGENSAVIRLGAALSRIRPAFGAKYFVHLRGILKTDCPWAEAGHVVASQQVKVDFTFAESIPQTMGHLPSSAVYLSVSTSGNSILVSRIVNGRNNVPLARIEKPSGSLCYLSHNGTDLLRRGVAVNTTRAATDNDMGGPSLTPGLDLHTILGFMRRNDEYSYSSRWKHVGLDQAAPPTMKCHRLDIDVADDKRQVDITAICDILSAERGQLLFNCIMSYSCRADGCIQITCIISPQLAVRWLTSLPRIGLDLQLDASLFHIQYFGRGPDENYPDRKSGSELAVYDTSPAKMGYLQYIYPIENGSRSDCDWIAFRGSDGNGLCICTDGPTFSCSALLHSATELQNAKHTCDLANRQNGQHPIHVNLDHQLMGVGGDTSWYPVVYEQYRVKPTQDFTFSFWLLPLQTRDNPAALVRSHRTRNTSRK